MSPIVAVARQTCIRGACGHDIPPHAPSMWCHFSSTDARGFPVLLWLRPFFLSYSGLEPPPLFYFQPFLARKRVLKQEKKIRYVPSIPWLPPCLAYHICLFRNWHMRWIGNPNYLVHLGLIDRCTIQQGCCIPIDEVGKENQGTLQSLAAGSP